MLVIISNNSTGKDQIIEYGIYDIYEPIAMRNISLIDKTLARPVQVFTVDRGNIVGIKTLSR